MAALRYTKHALEKMFERSISPDECEGVFVQGRTIESYPDDTPFPSELRIGDVGGKAIHVVVSFGPDAVHVITAYEPDPSRWDATLTKRRAR